MTTIAATTGPVTVGVDTHLDVHVAAVLDGLGRLLGSAAFSTDPAGNAALISWAQEHGTIGQVGVEGTGSYGAQLTRDLQRAGHQVIEVDRPDRKARRTRGKNDHLDAEAAARAVLSGRAGTAPKTRDGHIEAIRALRVARRSSVTGRTAAMNQLKALVLTAPAALREQLRTLTSTQLVKTAAQLRPDADLADPLAASMYAMREIALRHQFLTAQLQRLDKQLTTLVATAAPALIARHAIGTDTAGALLVALGDNPHRLRSEGSFAHLCGVAPLPATSGKTTGRHRLNRGGDRQANNALWRIVLVRMGTDQRTKDYVTRRTSQGLSKPEIMRCLKRYLAREVYTALQHHPSPLPLDRQ